MLTEAQGVFRSLGADELASSTSLCRASDYSGALQPTTGLPCCFTIPESCRANVSQTVSYTYSSGVFASSTTYAGNFSTTSGAASPSTPASVPTASNTGGGLIPTTTSRVTLSVTTILPSSVSQIPYTTTAPNLITGCGTASGSGTVIGSGTVYVGPFALIPVVSSGTASGYAAKVVGCGTLIATGGSFSGSGTITGCGVGSGTATMTGAGTVWPAVLGGLIPIVSSGIVTGSGRVEGCGTIVSECASYHGSLLTASADWFRSLYRNRALHDGNHSSSAADHGRSLHLILPQLACRRATCSRKSYKPGRVVSLLKCHFGFKQFSDERNCRQSCLPSMSGRCWYMLSCYVWC